MFHRVKSDTLSQGLSRSSSPGVRPADKTENRETAGQNTAYEAKTAESAASGAASPKDESNTVSAASSSPSSSAAPSSSLSTPNTEKDRKAMTADSRADNQNTTETGGRTYEIPGGASYQRPGQPAYPGAYPGAYAPKSSAPATPAARNTYSQEGADRRLVIGSGITMSGEIESCEHLIVEGTVEASLRGASLMDIAETGTFYGTVDIQEAVIAGRFEGDLTVGGRLTIRSTGIITGTVAYKELEVEAGAVIDGKITPLKGKPESTRRPEKSKDKETSSIKARKSEPKAEDKREPANSDDGELFAEKSVAAAE